MKEKSKVEIKEFFGTDVRVVNDDWIVMKDMFGALGRLTSRGQTESTDKTKLVKVVGRHNLKKFLIDSNNESISTGRGGNKRKSVVLECVSIKSIEDRDIECIFAKNKGFIHCGYKDEYSFYENVFNFFKHDPYIKIETQVKCMEFRLDMTIGSNFIIEFDESHHILKQTDDFERLQKIALSMSYSESRYTDMYGKTKTEKRLCDTNNYKDMYVETLIENDNFSVYLLNGVTFFRVRNKASLEWIPIMYSLDCEYKCMLEKFTDKYRKHSKNLSNEKVVY